MRAARLYERLGQYLHESGKTDAALVAFERGVDLVPTSPPSAERARALAGLGHGLMLAWRFDESLAICEQALALARSTGERAAELRALLNLGRDLAYLGRADEGVDGLEQVLALAAESGDPLALLDAYVALTDVLMMLGRPAESARAGQRGLEALHQYGIDSTVLVANTIEALLAIGAWDEAEQYEHGRAPRQQRQLPLHAPDAPRRPRAWPWRLRGGAGTSRRCPRRRSVRTAGKASTTSSSPSWPCGNGAGQTPTGQCTTAWKRDVPAKPLSCTSGSAPRGSVRKQNSQP